MGWPEPLGSLLAMPDSRAAQALRWGLGGLRGSLQTALDEAPNDPASAHLRALVKELDALLPRVSVAVLPADTPAESATDSPRPPASAALDPRVAAPDDPDLRTLAGIAAAHLWLAENDSRRLYHCLRSAFRFGLTPVKGEQRDRYVAEVLRLWERVRSAWATPGVAGRQEWKARVKACLDFDEALHSLTYQPPASPDSWWGRLQDQAREVLLRIREQAIQTGCPVHLQLLGGPFADLSPLAPDSLQVDFGVPGEVSLCLRVWARVDGEELKGRVLYRSPQEEP
jgi:hypothetical protein